MCVHVSTFHMAYKTHVIPTHVSYKHIFSSLAGMWATTSNTVL